MKKFSQSIVFSSRHGETPGDEQIERFIQVCNQYSNTNPDHIIGRVKIHVFQRITEFIF